MWSQAETNEAFLIGTQTHPYYKITYDRLLTNFCAQQSFNKVETNE